MTVTDGFILAAGLGTRMGPLSKALPKPAWTFNGRSVLELTAQAMRKAGLRTLGCNAHHLAETLKAVAGPELTIYPEPILLGSAGGLSHVARSAADPLAVMIGDAVAEVPWARFLEEHRRRGADLSWLLVPHPGGPWNPVWLDERGCIQLKEPTGNGPYHFTGAALWGAEALALIGEGIVDTKADILPHLGAHAGIVVEPFPWIEIGTPDQLIEAAAKLAPEAEGRIPGCYVHPTAEPLGILERCVLGPGARPHPAMRDANALWFEEEGRQVRLGL